MLQNQTAFSSQSGSQIEAQSIIQQILIFKYHSCLVNYRHEMTFDKYCSWLRSKSKNSQRRINIDSYLEDKDYLQSYNTIEQTMRKIYYLIKGKAIQSSFAPILSLNIEQNKLIKNIKRRYLTGLMVLPESNTMPTDQSQNREKLKDTQIERVATSYFKNDRQDKIYRQQDVSNIMLNKITQDLSTMIKNTYVFQPKQKELTIKFSKYFQQKYKVNRKKQHRKIFTQANISAIKSSLSPNKIYYSFEQEDCPEENYGLKKFKRSNSKTQVKKKYKKLKQQQKFCQKKKNISETKKKQSKLSLSPMTPKPLQNPKNQWGWGQSQLKKARSSFRFTTNKSKTKITKQKQAKSPKPDRSKNARVVKSPTLKRL